MEHFDNCTEHLDNCMEHSRNCTEHFSICTKDSRNCMQYSRKFNEHTDGWEGEAQSSTLRSEQPGQWAETGELKGGQFLKLAGVAVVGFSKQGEARFKRKHEQRERKPKHAIAQADEAGGGSGVGVSIRANYSWLIQTFL